METVADFDRIFDLPKGEVSLLLGRPGAGAESLALTIARGIADRKRSVFIYAPGKLLSSLDALWRAQESLVSLEGIMHEDALIREDRFLLEEAKARMKKKRIVLSGQAHDGTLKRALRAAKRTRRLSLLIVACPLMQKVGGALIDPAAELARLQAFAKKRRVPVLLLETASKSCDSRSSHLVYPTDVPHRELYKDITTRIFFTRGSYYDLEVDFQGYASTEVFMYRGEDCERIPCTWLDRPDAIVPYDKMEDAEQLYERAERYALRTREEDDPAADALVLTYYKRAAQMGLTDAEAAVAQLYADRGDWEEAAWRWENLGQKGYVPAMLKLADLYLQGYDIDYNAEKGIYWLGRAAEKDHLDALIELAACYLEGVHAEKDISRAAAFYRRAAELGCEEAKRKLKEISLSE